MADSAQEEGPADATALAEAPPASATAATTAPPAPSGPRPMNEMHGGCDHFALPLENEFKAWRGSVHELKAGVNPDSAGMLELNYRTRAKLEPQTKVKLAVKPEKNWRSPNHSFAGLLRFQVPSKGLYRLAAGSKLWLEIINARTKKRVPELTFEMQTKCSEIFKVIVYDLNPGDTFWLQVSEAGTHSADLLISPEIIPAAANPTPTAEK